MTDTEIPIWSLATAASDDGETVNWDAPDEGFSLERLDRLRRVLAVYDDNPPVLLERHAVRLADLPQGGRELPASSPILKSLSDLVGKTKDLKPTEKGVADGVLYRMVVPKEIAGDMSKGLARSMKATGDKSGAIYSGILGQKGIVANAKFLPVAASGGAAGAAATAGAAVTAGSIAVAAAPFVIMLVATAASVHAEEQRRAAIERLQKTLDEMRHEELENERDELNGSVPAIAKATAILADEGRLGHSLGLDSATHAIDTAVSRADRRIADWERNLEKLGAGATPDDLKKGFPGIDDDNGEFKTKLRMAVFAMATKRRLAVLQAAEHTQINPDISLARFTRALDRETEELDELERRMAAFLLGLTSLEIKVPGRALGLPFMGFDAGDVRSFLAWNPRLRGLAATESPDAKLAGDVEIGIVIPEDGPARVLEPVAVPPSTRRAR